MLGIYKAQTQNVRALRTARRVLVRLINDALIKKDDAQIRTLTTLLCVTFSCWAEARFSKLIHTPYGFTEDEVRGIRFNGDGRERAIEERWEVCIQVSLGKVPASTRSNEKPNCKRRLEEIVKRFIVRPSQLRNKIAHGQWVTALNRDHTGVNSDTTEEIALVDVIEVEMWFDIFEHLAQIVENIVESPEKTHRRDYWQHVADIESIIEQRKDWSVAKKQAALIEKKVRGIAKHRSAGTR